MNTSSSSLWYFARASGIVALLLLTATVILGILTTVRWSSRAWPRFAVEYLHRNITIVLLAFIALHVATIVVDGFAPIGWVSVFVPLSSPYRPVWLGLGAVAVDCLLAVSITSWLRHRVGFTVWRTVHWAGYAAWMFAVVHGLAAGTDTRQTWMLALDVACIGAVLCAVWWRLAVGWEQQTQIRIAALVVSLVIPLALFGFVVVGSARTELGPTLGNPATRHPAPVADERDHDPHVEARQMRQGPRRDAHQRLGRPARRGSRGSCSAGATSRCRSRSTSPSTDRSGVVGTC